jgi:hypothetical protein
MGLFGNLFSSQDTVRGAIEGAGTLAGDIRDAITGEENKLKARQLEQQLQLAQIELNKSEAESGSLFVAGWRPFLGWTGGLAVFYQFLFRPIASGFGLDMPHIDAAALWPLMFGLLGFGAYRTVEKSQGTQGRH